ncbi:MAG: ATP-binding protein [Clostridiales bacterium]|nr:ATP-binding protein [Clostridiales bacterium]
MGFYLNGTGAYSLFREDYSLTYFVDKSGILKELVPILELKNPAKNAGGKGKDPKYVCVTRPRRFGKTVIANMIAAYFGKGIDSSAEFDTLQVASCDWYKKHRNMHNVIRISFNELPDGTVTYTSYIARIKKRLLKDLRMAYPDAGIEKDDTIWDALTAVYEYCGGEKFIFVLDEWDYIYHQSFATDADRETFTKFLSNLLKDKSYVEMAYMTGILPIAKYSSGSELNMFFEYTMASKEKYSAYFGFTDAEVDDLYQRYRKVQEHPRLSREDLSYWYDGYQTFSGIRLYNPRSVVGALSDNQTGSYWTSSGPYDEIYYYVKADTGKIREEITEMIAGGSVPANVQEYASTSMELNTRDEIYSAMVVYGFLTCSKGCVSIPNKELMDKFADMVKQKSDFGYMHRLAVESGRMLKATLAGDTKTMLEILERVHDTESPLIRYSDEAELSKVITFVYLQAREFYDIWQEDRAGKGYVDFIFYPYRETDDGFIVELKVDDTVESAIQQIRDRNYVLGFDGKLGDRPKCTGRILAVGIAYDRKDPNKRHTCKVEVLRERRQEICVRLGL